MARSCIGRDGMKTVHNITNNNMKEWIKNWFTLMGGLWLGQIVAGLVISTPILTALVGNELTIYVILLIAGFIASLVVMLSDTK